MIMDFATLLSIISGFVTIEEAGRSGYKDFFKKPDKLNMDAITSEDSELLRLIDQLMSELKTNSRNVIDASEIEEVKRLYFENHHVPIQYYKDMEKTINDIMENLNTYLHKMLSVGEKTILKTQQMQSGKLDSLAEKIESIQKVLSDEKVANSTKEFIEKYQEDLFWDEEGTTVSLKDVYIEPCTTQGESVVKLVDAFLIDERQAVLFIEAVAGSGKSSLMARLAYDYGDSKHYFIKLSDLLIDHQNGLLAAISQYAITDPAWQGYLQNGNVLFLDGYDEIAARMNPEVLTMDIRRLKQKRMKLVVTTRPNYLHHFAQQHVMLNMDVFEKEQVEKWIHRYAEVKKLEEVVYRPYLEVLEDDEKFEIVEEVICIPIFLYIIVNKQIDLARIESQTQLFECVFEQLLGDKIDTEQYKLHMEIAKRMGYFLQMIARIRFRADHIDNFLFFINETLKQDLTKADLEKAFESSFIRNISEGSYEKEFYHKSIQDYFSASYIFDRLTDVVQVWRSGNVDAAALQYAELFDKADIKEELGHLKNMILKLDEEKRAEWVWCFQKVFQNFMVYGLKLDPKPWFKVGIRKDNERFALTDYLRKNKLITVCHIEIMMEIFKEKIFCDSYMTSYFLHTIIDEANEALQINRAQFIWNFYYGQVLSTKDLTSLVAPANLLAVMLSDSFTTARKIQLSGGRFQLERGERATGKFKECILESIQIEKTKFHEFFLERTKLKSFTLLSCYLEYTRVKECIIEDSTIFSSLYSVKTYGSTIKTTQIGNKKYNNPMKVSSTAYENVIFDSVTFLALQCDDKTVFHNVTFQNCTFSSSIGKHFQLIDCKMDQPTWNNFEHFHPDLCQTVHIEIIGE